MRVAIALLLISFLLAPTASAATLHVAQFRFDPLRLNVTPGEQVTVFSRADEEPHRMKATTGDTIYVDLIPTGGNVTFTAPTTPGEYPYYCPFHTSADSSDPTYMQGVLVVRVENATPTSSTGPSGNAPISTTQKTPGFETVALAAALVGAAMALRRR